jgi:hypothetical protein
MASKLGFPALGGGAQPSAWARVAVAGAVFFAAMLTAAAAAASITVQIDQPAGASTQAGPLSVAATVVSTFQLQSVVAQVDTLNASLTYTTGNSWTGSLALTALTLGPKTLTVTATDIYGSTATGSAAFRYRHPPTVVVDQPLWGDVVGATVRVRASCLDESPATCTVSAGPGYPGPGGAIQTGLGTLDATFPLIPGWFETDVYVTNDAGQSSWGAPLAVISDPSLLGLHPVSCAPGEILDFDATRFLFQSDPSGIRFADRSAGGSTLIFPNLAYSFPPNPPNGNLTYLGSNNIEFAFNPVNIAYTFESWRAGTQLPEATYRSLAMGGDRAVHDDGSGHSIVTNLADGGEVPLPNATRGYASAMVTPSGAVLYDEDWGGGVARWVDGTVSEVAPQRSLVTGDDTNVVVTGAGIGQYAIFSVNGPDGGTPIAADGNWMANGGWLAFARTPDAGPPQVWSRSPAGVEAQVSFFGAGASVEALGDTGEIAMKLSTGDRWVGRAGAPPVQVDPMGTIRWLDGNWYVTVGRMLFRLESTCTAGDPECGAMVDAGAFPATCTASGSGDAGAPLDGGDSGVLEGGALDSGVLDSGALDGGVFDSDTLDSHTLDGGVLEGGGPIPDASDDRAPSDSSTPSSADATMGGPPPSPDSGAARDVAPDAPLASPGGQPGGSSSSGGCDVAPGSGREFGATRWSALVVALALMARAGRRRSSRREGLTRCAQR